MIEGHTPFSSALALQIRMIEGQQGTLTAYVAPASVPKVPLSCLKAPCCAVTLASMLFPSWHHGATPPCSLRLPSIRPPQEISTALRIPVFISPHSASQEIYCQVAQYTSFRIKPLSLHRRAHNADLQK